MHSFTLWFFYLLSISLSCVSVVQLLLGGLGLVVAHPLDSVCVCVCVYGVVGPLYLFPDRVQRGRIYCQFGLVHSLHTLVAVHCVTTNQCCPVMTLMYLLSLLLDVLSCVLLCPWLYLAVGSILLVD